MHRRRYLGKGFEKTSIFYNAHGMNLPRQGNVLRIVCADPFGTYRLKCRFRVPPRCSSTPNIFYGVRHALHC